MRDMMLAWLPFAMALVACMAAARPATEPAPAFDGMALYRSGRMHELREQLRARLRAPSRSADVAARDAILLARTYIDLCVVWDAGSLDDASAVLAAARPSAPKLVRGGRTGNGRGAVLALAAARAAHDPRTELDVLVSYGDQPHLEEARRLAGIAHLPLPSPRPTDAA